MPVMPFWLVKPSTSWPLTKLAVIAPSRAARLALSTSVTVSAGVDRGGGLVLGVVQRMPAVTTGASLTAVTVIVSVTGIRCWRRRHSR